MATSNTSKVYTSSYAQKAVANSKNLGNRTAVAKAQAQNPSLQKQNTDERQARSFNSAVADNKAAVAAAAAAATPPPVAAPTSSFKTGDVLPAYQTPSGMITSVVPVGDAQSKPTANDLLFAAKTKLPGTPAWYAEQNSVSNLKAVGVPSTTTYSSAKAYAPAPVAYVQGLNASERSREAGAKLQAPPPPAPLTFLDKTRVGNVLIPSGVGLDSDLVTPQSKTGTDLMDKSDKFLRFTNPVLFDALKTTSSGITKAGNVAGELSETPFFKSKINPLPIKGASLVLKGTGSFGSDVYEKPTKNVGMFYAGGVLGKAVVGPVLSGARDFIGVKAASYAERKGVADTFGYASKVVSRYGAVGAVGLGGVAAYDLGRDPEGFGKSLSFGIGLGAGTVRGFKPSVRNVNVFATETEVPKFGFRDVQDLTSPTGRRVSVKAGTTQYSEFTADVFGKPASGLSKTEGVMVARGDSPSQLFGDFGTKTSSGLTRFNGKAVDIPLPSSMSFGSKEVVGLNLESQKGFFAPGKESSLAKPSNLDGSSINPFFKVRESKLTFRPVTQVRGQENARFFSIDSVTPVAERSFGFPPKQELFGSRPGDGFDFMKSVEGVKGGELYGGRSLVVKEGKVVDSREAVYQRKYKSKSIDRSELYDFVGGQSPVLGAKSSKNLGEAKIFGKELSIGRKVTIGKNSFPVFKQSLKSSLSDGRSLLDQFGMYGKKNSFAPSRVPEKPNPTFFHLDVKGLKGVPKRVPSNRVPVRSGDALVGSRKDFSSLASGRGSGGSLDVFGGGNGQVTMFKPPQASLVKSKKSFTEPRVLFGAPESVMSVPRVSYAKSLFGTAFGRVSASRPSSALRQNVFLADSQSSQRQVPGLVTNLFQSPRQTPVSRQAQVPVQRLFSGQVQRQSTLQRSALREDGFFSGGSVPFSGAGLFAAPPFAGGYLGGFRGGGAGVVKGRRAAVHKYRGSLGGLFLGAKKGKSSLVSEALGFGVRGI